MKGLSFMELFSLFFMIPNNILQLLLLSPDNPFKFLTWVPKNEKENVLSVFLFLSEHLQISLRENRRVNAEVGLVSSLSKEGEELNSKGIKAEYQKSSFSGLATSPKPLLAISEMSELDQTEVEKGPLSSLKRPIRADFLYRIVFLLGRESLKQEGLSANNIFLVGLLMLAKFAQTHGIYNQLKKNARVHTSFIFNSKIYEAILTYATILHILSRETNKEDRYTLRMLCRAFEWELGYFFLWLGAEGVYLKTLKRRNPFCGSQLCKVFAHSFYSGSKLVVLLWPSLAKKLRQDYYEKTRLVVKK